MRILVACEFSGVVRDAFHAQGHEAWSCDLLPSETKGLHLQGDVREYLDQDWDLMVAFPPCTYLCRAGIHWNSRRPERRQLTLDALDFVRTLLSAPIPQIALENPIGCISTKIRPPDQVIHPWEFGHGEEKTTCLWLKGLPRLIPTAIVSGRHTRIHRLPPGPNRWKERSRTYSGIAQAMASQWSTPIQPVRQLEFPWTLQK